MESILQVFQVRSDEGLTEFDRTVTMVLRSYPIDTLLQRFERVLHCH